MLCFQGLMLYKHQSLLSPNMVVLVKAIVQCLMLLFLLQKFWEVGSYSLAILFSWPISALADKYLLMSRDLKPRMILWMHSSYHLKLLSLVLNPQDMQAQVRYLESMILFKTYVKKKLTGVPFLRGENSFPRFSSICSQSIVDEMMNITWRIFFLFIYASSCFIVGTWKGTWFIIHSVEIVKIESCSGF